MPTLSLLVIRPLYLADWPAQELTILMPVRWFLKSLIEVKFDKMRTERSRSPALGGLITSAWLSINSTSLNQPEETLYNVRTKPLGF